MMMILNIYQYVFTVMYVVNLTGTIDKSLHWSNPLYPSSLSST